MAISALLSPNLLNGGLFGNPNKNGYAKEPSTDAFDKRSTSQGDYFKTTNKMSEYRAWIDMVSNAIGVRSPYYTIGEIQGTSTGQYVTRYMQNQVGDTIRAITSTIDAFSGNGQAGVIIDGFGDVSGKIDVEFSKNPVVFVSNSVSDNRIRNPNTVNMKVFVSNYYNDNGLGAAVDYMTSTYKEKTGIAAEAIKWLFNNGNTRAQEALYNLRRIQERGRPFTIYTPHGVYENMLIQSLKPKTTAENVDMLECDIVFQEVIMYEPYYTSEDDRTYPERTNVISDDDSTTWGSIKSSFSKSKDKINTMWDKVFGGKTEEAAATEGAVK